MCLTLQRIPFVLIERIREFMEGDGETRVAAIPETVKKFAGLGASIAVEKGAGDKASIADADFEAAGATMGSRSDVLKDADIILSVMNSGRG